MAYQDSEISVHGAKPVELYKFVGTYASFFYTSGPEAITFLGDTYLPIAIKRSDVRTGTQDDDGLDVNIEMPVSVQMVKTYAFATAPPSLHLTIYRYHRGAPADYVAYWSGPVNNIQVSGGRATMRSPSALAHALVGAVPNVYYQSPCNHVLYDSRCKVVEALYTVNTTATVVNGKTITVASIGTLTGKLVGGELRNAAGERRMITGQADNVLTVNFPFATLEVAGAVSVIAGCDHAYSGDCLTRFDNQINFGGFPFIPNENVFQEGMEPGKTLPDNTCLPPLWNPVFEGWYAMARFHVLTPGIGLPGGFFADPSGSPPTLFMNSGSAYSNGVPKVVYVDGDTVEFYWIDPAVMDSTTITLQIQYSSGAWAGGGPPKYGEFSFTRWDTPLTGTLPPYAGPSTSDPFQLFKTFPEQYHFNI